MSIPTVADVKANLILTGNEDDTFIGSLILAAVSYAEAYQHLPDGYYTTAVDGVIPPMTARTAQGVVMLCTRWYESRDGGTGGFYADKSDAAQYADVVINNLLRLDRDWKVG